MCVSVCTCSCVNFRPLQSCPRGRVGARLSQLSSASPFSIVWGFSTLDLPPLLGDSAAWLSVFQVGCLGTPDQVSLGCTLATATDMNGKERAFFPPSVAESLGELRSTHPHEGACPPLPCFISWVLHSTVESDALLRLQTGPAFPTWLSLPEALVGADTGAPQPEKASGPLGQGQDCLCHPSSVGVDTLDREGTMCRCP